MLVYGTLNKVALTFRIHENVNSIIEWSMSTKDSLGGKNALSEIIIPLYLLWH